MERTANMSVTCMFLGNLIIDHIRVKKNRAKIHHSIKVSYEECRIVACSLSSIRSLALLVL